MELEATFGATSVRGLDDLLAAPPHEAAQRRVGQVVDRLVDLLLPLRALRAYAVEPASPVRLPAVVPPQVAGAPEGVDDEGLVAAGQCRVIGPRLERREPAEEVVAGVGAVLAEAHESSGLGDDLRDVGHHRRWRGGPAQDVGLDEVPVGVELRDERADVLVQVDAERAADLERVRHVVGIEQLGLQLRPPGLERDRRRHLIEHLHQGRQLRLDGVLGEDPLREGVQGADGGDVEVVQGRGRAGARRRVVGRQHDPLERGPQPVPELGGGALGEGHRGDGTDGDGVVEDERANAVDQRRGLAGSGAGLDEERLVGPLTDAGPRGVVRQSLTCHRAGPLVRGAR